MRRSGPGEVGLGSWLSLDSRGSGGAGWRGFGVGPCSVVDGWEPVVGTGRDPERPPGSDQVGVLQVGHLPVDGRAPKRGRSPATGWRCRLGFREVGEGVILMDAPLGHCSFRVGGVGPGVRNAHRPPVDDQVGIGEMPAVGLPDALWWPRRSLASGARRRDSVQRGRRECRPGWTRCSAGRCAWVFCSAGAR